MKIFVIRINCKRFIDVEIEAEDEDTAIMEAQTNEHKCPGDEWEYCETVEIKEKIK